MRSVDLKELEQPYPKLPDGRTKTDLASALGWKLDSLRRLMGLIRNDLDPVNYGIGWWKTSSETTEQLRLRIVVADYLAAAVESVELNLIDLRLHFLELRDWWAREGDFLKEAVSIGPNGDLIPKMPPRLRPLDELAPAMVDVHINGVFRSVASTLDCLASVVIGVGAFELDILHGDWSRLIDKQLPKIVDDGTPGRALQLSLRADLTALLSHGEKEWDRWASDYRNMLVHRGQRLKLSALDPLVLYDSREQPLVRTSCVHVLQRDPELSDIEALALSDHTPPVLTEDGKTTLEGLSSDLAGLVEGVSTKLADLWEQRRTKPQLLAQPCARQWKQVRRASYRNFRGYKPRQVPYNPGAFSANPVFVRRLQAASLMNGDEKKNWK